MVEHTISIHALREEGDFETSLQSGQSFISIHALREEGDFMEPRASSMVWNFYPRPPRGGRPAMAHRRSGHRRDFYPRPPRGGRHSEVRNAGRGEGISIHALREEGDRRRPHQRPVGGISIHALREEGDPPSRRPVQILWIFLSTPSARRATKKGVFLNLTQEISIHALREEGDFGGLVALHDLVNISIHALREEGDLTR